jgi:hypothetical protein
VIPTSVMVFALRLTLEPLTQLRAALPPIDTETPVIREPPRMSTLLPLDAVRHAALSMIIPRVVTEARNTMPLPAEEIRVEEPLMDMVTDEAVSANTVDGPALCVHTELPPIDKVIAELPPLMLTP